MLLYLLFFGGGMFDIYEDDFMSLLLGGKGGLYLCVFMLLGMSEWVKLVMDCIKQVFDYYYCYMGILLLFMKFDMVVVNDVFKEQKDLNFGGMENWGLIFEFVDDILLQLGQLMLYYGNEVLMYEVVYQWFGDFVIIDWWDNVWFNELFVMFFEMKMMIQFFFDEFSWFDQVKNKYCVINCDIGLNVFLVVLNFNDWVLNDFVLSVSVFMYDKGGYVLKMFENYFGEQMLCKGLQQYLVDYLFGNGMLKCLWDVLLKESGQVVGLIGDSYVCQIGVLLILFDM